MYSEEPPEGMRDFFKEHGILVAGVALPLIVTGLFVAATQIDRETIEPPIHGVLFSTGYDHHQRTVRQGDSRNCNLRFQVKDGALRFQFTPAKGEDGRCEVHLLPELFLYDPEAQSSRRVELPSIENEDEELDLPVPALQSEKLSKAKESPDGYVFERGRGGSGNFLTDLFGAGSSRNRYVLSKDGQRIRVPETEDYSTAFIAWVL